MVLCICLDFVGMGFFEGYFFSEVNTVILKDFA